MEPTIWFVEPSTTGANLRKNLRQKPADTICSFDLPTFVDHRDGGAVSAVELLIQEAQDFTLEVEEQPEQRQPIVACMVVLGFPPARERETLEAWLSPYRITPDAVDRLVRVGAVYYEIPAEPRYAQRAPRRHYFSEQMKALYGSGPVEEASDPMAGLIGNSVTPVVADPYSESQHLQIYRNPPFQLSDDDFQRLLERIAMPDEDWRKDD